jgi:biopolymer transport protein ExbD
MRRGVLTGRSGRGGGATIEMAPLIDMVFILLIFYIVSTSFVQDAGVVVNRPGSRSAEPVTSRFLPVAVTKLGTVHVAGRAIGPDEFGAIESALSDMRVRRVVIQADREVPTALLLRVYDSCRAAGAEIINVAAIAKP